LEEARGELKSIMAIMAFLAIMAIGLPQFKITFALNSYVSQNS
jgi:hypothetical protein